MSLFINQKTINPLVITVKKSGDIRLCRIYFEKGADETVTIHVSWWRPRHTKDIVHAAHKELRSSGTNSFR